MRTAFVIGSLFCLSQACAQEEGGGLRLRGGYERYDDSYKVSVDTPLIGTGDDTHHWDQNNGYFIESIFDLPFLMIGVSGFLRQRDDDYGTTTLDYETYGVRGDGGLTLPLIPKLLHLEFMAFVGVGKANLDYDTPIGGDSDSDTFWEYGAHIDGVVTFGRFECGLGLGYSWSEADFTQTVGGVDLDVKIKEEVPLARIFFGMTF